MSGVYLATQVPLGRSVALKILVPLVEDAAGEASFEERFRLEARTLATLNHPNIVVLYDYGETEDGRFYLAMEFVDGPRLSDLLKEAGRLPLQRTLQVVLQTCAALRYAHNRGVVHRDIKLSNIMLFKDQDGREQVKVVDFGLVKLTENDQRLTHAGMVLGSPHFIAPEQARGQPVDHRADIYAVGVTLFCMLAGKPPFTGATATATILAHLTQPVPTLESLAPDLQVPPAVEAILQRCLAKRAEERYPDMNHLIADLAALSDGSLPGTLRADGPSSSTIISFQTSALPVAPEEKKKLVLIAALAAVLLLMVGGALMLGVIRVLQAGGTSAGTATVAPPTPVVPAAAGTVTTPTPTPTEAAAATAEPATEPATSAEPAAETKPSASTPAKSSAQATRPRQTGRAPTAATQTTPATTAETTPTPAETPKVKAQEDDAFKKTTGINRDWGD